MWSWRSQFLKILLILREEGTLKVFHVIVDRICEDVIGRSGYHSVLRYERDC
jgi:hypothetical protein